MENANPHTPPQDGSTDSHQTHKSKSYSSLLKMTRKNNRGKNGGNPTLSYLRDAIGSDTPDIAQRNYRPYINRKPRTVGKDVFKVSSFVMTKLHQVILFATNNSSTISGDDMKNIQKFKIGKGQDWPLTETLVGLSYRMKNAPEEYEMKCFCLDIPAFLHTFFDPQELKHTMINVAEELSSSWNDLNSNADMAEKRKDSEIPILIDFRKNAYSKAATELILAGTTFNQTLMTQNSYKDIKCKREDIFFQLRYQTSEGKPKRGMISLPLNEWISILENPEFASFYQQVWKYLPLPQLYSTRIEAYAKQIELAKQRVDEEQDQPINEDQWTWAEPPPGSSNPIT